MRKQTSVHVPSYPKYVCVGVHVFVRYSKHILCAYIFIEG